MAGKCSIGKQSDYFPAPRMYTKRVQINVLPGM